MRQVVLDFEFYWKLLSVTILSHGDRIRKLAKLLNTMGHDLKLVAFLFEFEHLLPVGLANPFLRLTKKCKLNLNLPIHETLIDFFRRGNGLYVNLGLTGSLLSLAIYVLVWPITRFEFEAPKHTVNTLEKSGLYVVAPIIVDLVVFVDKLMNFIKKWFTANIMKNPQKCGLAVGLDSPENMLVAMKHLTNLLPLGMLTWTEPLD